MPQPMYQQKTNDELLRYYRRILDDITFCDRRAGELGYGAGGDHFRRAAKEAQAEAERAKSELDRRGLLQ
jgi:hypothetical protein